MLITLNDRTYRVVRMNDKLVVMVETGPRSSRLAEPSIAALVLAGLTAPVFA